MTKVLSRQRDERYVNARQASLSQLDPRICRIHDWSLPGYGTLSRNGQAPNTCVLLVRCTFDLKDCDCEVLDCAESCADGAKWVHELCGMLSSSDRSVGRCACMTHACRESVLLWGIVCEGCSVTVGHQQP